MLKLKERCFAFLHFQIIIIISFALPIVGYFLLKDSTETNWILFVFSCIIFYSLGIVMQKQLIKKDISTVFIFSVLLFVFVFALGTPQLKAFENKSYTNIKTFQASQNVNLYSYEYIAPEVIWKYGKPIQNIKQDSLNYKLPEDSKFGLLASFDYYPERDGILQNKYTIQLINNIDTNTAQPNTRAHKERLEYRFYILTKK